MTVEWAASWAASFTRPQVNVQETEAKENVPELQMEKQLIEDKQVTHQGAWREQPVALLVPTPVVVNIWEHQDRLQIWKTLIY